MREILHRTTEVRLTVWDHLSGIFGKPFIVGAMVEYEGPPPEARVTVYAAPHFGGERYAEAQQQCSPYVTAQLTAEEQER